MTIAKDFAAKASVAFVAAAMLFSMIAPAAQAQSAEDLQKMINDLMGQIAALQGQGGTSSSVASGICPYTWTRDLKTGATGADVMKLQQFLNSNADTRVSASGVGSVGMETEYFGPATAAAVSKFQVMHRAEVLTPAGLVNPTGYFGPGTRAKANALCVATTGGSTTGGSTTGGSTTGGDDNSSSGLSGEADFDDATLDSASDDTVEEGQEDAEIAELTVSFTDGDASISRLDVELDPATTAKNWDLFDTVSVWVDGDMVAEMDASDKDSYQNDDMTLRFNGLDIVAMEDEDLDITIAATFQDGIDSGDLGDVDVDVVGMRYFDAGGVAETLTAADIDVDSVQFTLEAAGANDEIVVKSATSDPEATTLKLEDDSKSDWYTVFAFDIDTNDSVNDIELTTLPLTLTLSSSTYATIVDDVELVIDGVTIDDVTVSSTTVAAPTLTFDVDGDVTIDAGDRLTAELRVRFKSLAAGNEGMTVTGSVSSTNVNNIVAEGADDLDNTSPDQLTGSATGDAHALRTTGVDVSVDSDSAVVTTGDNAGDDYATFKLVLDVTAFEQDVFVSTNQATSVVATIVDGAGATVGGTSTVVITSSADVEGGSFKINEGETETVTITVTFDATTAGAAARFQLSSLKFDESDSATPAQTWSALPVTDYRTDIVTLVN